MTFLQQRDIIGRQRQIGIVLLRNPLEGGFTKETDMGQITNIVPVCKGLVVPDAFGHDCQPAAGFENTKQALEFTARIVQMLYNLGTGNEIIILVPDTGVGIIENVIRPDAHAGFPEHGGKQWSRSGAEIEPQRAGLDPFQQGFGQAREEITVTIVTGMIVMFIVFGFLGNDIRSLRWWDEYQLALTAEMIAAMAILMVLVGIAVIAQWT